MQSLVLPPPARQALAQAALTYRYGDEHQPVTTADILTPRRREDYGKDLWSAYQTIAEFLGDPVMATLIAVLIAMFTFGLNRGRSMDQINDTLVSSIKIIAMMLLIIGGGGAFKQVHAVS